MARRTSNKEDASELGRRLDDYIKQITDHDGEVNKSEEEWRQSMRDGLRTLAKAVAFLLKRDYERGKRVKEMNEQSLLAGSREEIEALNGGHEPKNVLALPAHQAAGGAAAESRS